MTGKQAFKFFVGDSPHDWHRNKEIFSTFLNRITVDEDAQCEVISVENVEFWDNKDSVAFAEGDPVYQWLFDRYQNNIEDNEQTIKQSLS